MNELPTGLFVERRRGTERRHTTLSSFVHGLVNPRRRSGRRNGDRDYPVIDWHPARIFTAALLILLLCISDAILTLVLMSHGAVEANPIMAFILPKGLAWFAAAKLALTSIGCFVLVACSRMRLFRTLPGETMLYGIAALYLALIAYELRLLDRLQS
jgi:hypothetical protein